MTELFQMHEDQFLSQMRQLKEHLSNISTTEENSMNDVNLEKARKCMSKSEKGLKSMKIELQSLPYNTKQKLNTKFNKMQNDFYVRQKRFYRIEDDLETL